MDKQDDRDWVIKARFRFTEDDTDDSYWDEVFVNNDVRTPCYAFRRGNILFTTTPPPRKPPESQKSCTSVCNIKVSDKTLKVPQADGNFCEVCCGIRSPSFSRRAHSFTTHFCTRVPAKKSVTGSGFGSDHRSKSSDSTVSSSNSSNVGRSYRNLLASRGHISRLSAYLNTKPSPDDDEGTITSSDYTSETSSSGVNGTTDEVGSTCRKCGLSSTSTMASKSSAASCAYSSYSSSYPSSCSSYFPFFLNESFDSSACCGCSSDSCATGSLGGSGKISRNQKARFFSNDSSSESDETCSSEMGWSFGSFCDLKQKRDSGCLSRTTTAESVSSKEAARNTKPKSIMPFGSNTNRKFDVVEKFGDVVRSLRKPGHHVGPSKNSECLCDNCRAFFCKK